MTIGRQAVLGLPPELEPHTHGDPKELDAWTEEAGQMLLNLVMEELGVPVVMVNATWMVTCKAEEIDGLPYLDDCPNGYACDTCNEGRRAAKLYLASRPGKHVVIGLFSFDLPFGPGQSTTN